MIISKPKTYHEWKYPTVRNTNGLWNDIILPIARRFAAATMGLDLVTVQPMAGPVGNLFFLDQPPPIATFKSKWNFEKPITFKWWRIQQQYKALGIKIHKGSELLTPGYIYAPYVPMMREPAIIEGDFTPRQGILSRYSTRIVNQDYFGRFDINYHGD